MTFSVECVRGCGEGTNPAVLGMNIAMALENNNPLILLQINTEGEVLPS